MNRVLKRIACDEDGVALAFGIAFFLLIFLLGMSVYAAGESVRQRMELQNAADAAAYSAAVVQADTLSRVACINKAMSWTYVMLNRRCMDYAVDKWLEKVEQKWDEDFERVRNWNMQSTCGTQIEGSDYRAGISAHRTVLLNSSVTMIDIIKAQRKAAAAAGKSYQALQSRIDWDRETLAAMRSAEENLFSSLSGRIEDVVEASVKANISETPNDSAAGGADIQPVVIHNSYDTYTETMRNDAEQEKIFLVFGDFKPDPREISMRGVDVWWKRGFGGEGFSREYRQTGSLTATWNWHGIKWVLTPDACVPVPIFGMTTVRGSEVQDGYFETGEPAKPFRLKREFFGDKGTILVGVKRRLNNPFAFLFEGGAAQGLFSAFTVRDKRSMWAVAAARAAYAPPDNSRSKGAYEATFLNVGAAESWNLCEADWDAVFIPVANAFDQGEDRAFRRSGRSPLPEVYSKLSPGSVSAPPGMNGSFNLNSREGLLH